MSKFFRLLPGFSLVLLAVIGLGISIFCLWHLFGLKDRIISQINAGIELAGNTLSTTSQALDVLENTLNTVSADISSTREALLTLAQTIHDAIPLISSLSTLTGKTIPDTLTATQDSLATAQTTAKTIEDILRLITRIPLITSAPYNPQVPLYIALGQVAADLDRIQPQLQTMQQDLTDSRANLSALELDIFMVSQDLLQINQNLAEALKVVSQYKELVNALQIRLDGIQRQVPGWVSIATNLSGFVLIWIAFYQVDLLIRGIKLIR